MTNLKDLVYEYAKLHTRLQNNQDFIAEKEHELAEAKKEAGKIQERLDNLYVQFDDYKFISKVKVHDGKTYFLSGNDSDLGRITFENLPELERNYIIQTAHLYPKGFTFEITSGGKRYLCHTSLTNPAIYLDSIKEETSPKKSDLSEALVYARNQIALNTPIEEVIFVEKPMINQRIRNALKLAGIHTIKNLLSIDDQELIKIDGVGLTILKYINELKDSLKELKND